MSSLEEIDFKIDRLPKGLQEKFRELYSNGNGNEAVHYLHPNEIYLGDARQLPSELFHWDS